MAQNTVDFSIDPSGDQLLDVLLDNFQTNILTSNSGSTRPSYAQIGTIWVDQTTSPWVLNMFNGDDDIVIGTLDPVGLKFKPSDASDATAAQIQEVLESITFANPIEISSIDSPYDVDGSESGQFLIVDTSAGDVTINLPLISETGTPYNITVKKNTPDNNVVNIVRDGTDVIDGSDTVKTLISVQASTFIAYNSTPNNWQTLNFGAGAGQAKKQLFTLANGDFEAGDTSLTITSTPIPVSSTALHMSRNGVVQHSDAFSYNPDTGVVTFDAITNETTIEFSWDSIGVQIGTPSDGTISWSKFATGVIGSLSDIIAGATQKFATCKAVLDYVTASKQRVVIDTFSFTNEATIDMDLPFDDTQYIGYLLVCDDLSLAADAVLTGRIKTASGAQTTNYSNSETFGGNAGAAAASLTQLEITRAGTGQAVSGDSDHFVRMIFDFPKMQTTDRKKPFIYTTTAVRSDNITYRWEGAATWLGGNDAITGIQIYCTTAVNLSGNFTLYGIKY